MSGQANDTRKVGNFRRFLRAPAIAGSVAALALFVVPTVSNALAGKFDSAAPVSLAARGGIGSFTPASVDPRLASQLNLPALAHGKLFRFTPAGSETRPDRAVTVAIRVDGARAISVHGALPASAMAPGAAPIRIAPTVYSLGAARGYQSFAAGASLPREIQRLDVPDLRSFTPAGSTAAVNPGRLAPRIQLDEKDRTGRAPRTLENQGDYQVDLGGSYRLTRNFNVTAGIRYSSERDRLRPLTDGKQDSQAVYVGTQFRF
ncbi:hypothetical protein OLX02_10475 [Novosphingobium sp. KCTC 2891]|uniref:hypothetical protein n=1 Tax=Novosphingobium sp. KCTC 2891 TaxID=2989730 RepID=UPI0022228A1E|nr:hypothetical protein [Novosphingobium sp. KCTC 2891]MCW1383247.1 hypothetical protein [Novosphingobium sp. KCTC 2891]